MASMEDFLSSVLGDDMLTSCDEEAECEQGIDIVQEGDMIDDVLVGMNRDMDEDEDDAPIDFDDIENEKEEEDEDSDGSLETPMKSSTNNYDEEEDCLPNTAKIVTGNVTKGKKVNPMESISKSDIEAWSSPSLSSQVSTPTQKSKPTPSSREHSVSKKRKRASKQSDANSKAVTTNKIKFRKGHVVMLTDFVDPNNEKVKLLLKNVQYRFAHVDTERFLAVIQTSVLRSVHVCPDSTQQVLSIDAEKGKLYILDNEIEYMKKHGVLLTSPPGKDKSHIPTLQSLMKHPANNRDPITNVCYVSDYILTSTPEKHILNQAQYAKKIQSARSGKKMPESKKCDDGACTNPEDTVASQPTSSSGRSGVSLSRSKKRKTASSSSSSNTAKTKESNKKTRISKNDATKKESKRTGSSKKMPDKESAAQKQPTSKSSDDSKPNTEEAKSPKANEPVLQETEDVWIDTEIDTDVEVETDTKPSPEVTKQPSVPQPKPHNKTQVSQTETTTKMIEASSSNQKSSLYNFIALYFETRCPSSDSSSKRLVSLSFSVPNEEPLKFKDMPFTSLKQTLQYVNPLFLKYKYVDIGIGKATDGTLSSCAHTIINVPLSLFSLFV